MDSRGMGSRDVHGEFVIKVRIGDYEVELGGTREEVLKTIEDLPRLVANVHKAFEATKPRTVATLTVKTGKVGEETQVHAQKYPKISPAQSTEEAVVQVLKTDWGKWRPRKLDELREALQTNGMNCSGRVLAGVLMGLAKKGKVRRWNTDAGFVYILVEDEAFELRREAE